MSPSNASGQLLSNCFHIFVFSPYSSHDFSSYWSRVIPAFWQPACEAAGVEYPWRFDEMVTFTVTTEVRRCATCKIFKTNLPAICRWLVSHKWYHYHMVFIVFHYCISLTSSCFCGILPDGGLIIINPHLRRATVHNDHHSVCKGYILQFFLKKWRSRRWGPNQYTSIERFQDSII